MILQADNGGAVVFMNTDDYHNKSTLILSETSTYQVLKKDPHPKYAEQVMKKLRKLKNERIP